MTGRSIRSSGERMAVSSIHLRCFGLSDSFFEAFRVPRTSRKLEKQKIQPVSKVEISDNYLVYQYFRDSYMMDVPCKAK